MTWLSGITVGQAIKHLTAYFSAVLTAMGLFWTVAKPRAEDFVRSTVAQEKFATHEELEKQTRALEELSETVEKQSRTLDEQNMQMGIISNDMGTVKTLQKDTLRAILKLAPDE